jgi:hypothetical protein
LVGADLELISFSSNFEMNNAGSINSFVETKQQGVTYFNPDGTVYSSDEESESRIEAVVSLFDSGSWLMLDYGRPEGT